MATRTTIPAHAPLSIVLFLLGAVAWADDQPVILADFEDATANELIEIQAKATAVTLAGNNALSIATEADADYPGVLIKPKQGKWDLSDYDVVKMDVANPQSVQVRVLLSVANPGSDGRNKCNTEAAVVLPGKKATLAVPFGSWHGETNRPIDQANIISAQVMLDRPGRAHQFIVDNIRAEKFNREHMASVLADPFYQKMSPVLGRGVNLGNALDAPNEGEWGVRLEERYFDLIKEAGFDSVRIPVRWSNHAAKDAPHTLDPKFAARVDWAIDNTLERGLEAVVNMHHYEEIFQDPRGQKQRFLAIWRQIAERYKDKPDSLYFELLNEPHDKLTAELWNEMLVETIQVVRGANPTRKIVVGPGSWNAIGALESLELPKDDPHLIVTFHYYSPFQFTHQGASWVGGNAGKWLGTKWQGTRAEQEAVRRDLDTALAWAVKHKRQVYMGEFGAYSKADMDSRARWTKFVADEAIKRNISIAYWEFCAGFGVYDPDNNRWRDPLKEALLPR
jgi:aryl-phospho-beta-D-glucosidase BglC (GH1 family)